MESDGKNGIIGKKILVIFEDGKDHFSRKVGICTDFNSVEIVLDNKDVIPKHRVVRAEVM